MIPIDREGGEKAQTALNAAENVLQRGELFGIFPEGTRSRDGMLYKGKTGAARLALKLNCPIFPVGIVGTREIQPPDAKLPRVGGRVNITIGKPILPERYAQRSDDHLVLREMTDEVMFEIQSMTGQQYRNVYAGKRQDEHSGHNGPHREPVGTAK
jgi:1-acyl-sn-glycerol-3-phosphate acyltransferase